MPPSLASTSTHFALVIDAGSSGSRLQIYSWRDPDLERAEIVEEVRSSQASISASLRGDDGQTSGGWPWVESSSSGGSRKWWWPTDYLRGSRKGKGKEVGYGELEQRALRRLVRVGKGVEGDDWVKRAEPGISTISPTDIPEYLAPLLTHALQHIPPSQHAQTPIYLYATAGMRLLPPENQTAILKATCDAIRRDYPFQVGSSSSAGPCGENIRVISGEEEGLWGWVAVNYLMDGFGHAPPYDTPAASIPSSSPSLLPLAPLAEPPPSSVSDSVTPVDVAHHSPTFGFLDMGGASTQLAFSPTELELSRSGYPTEELRKVSLRLLSGEEVDWQVFVASWLGFGTNRVRERYVDTLLSAWSSSSSSTDTSTPLPDPCLPINLSVSTSMDSTTPPLIGTGSFDTCLTRLKTLLAQADDCPAKHCLFAGLPTPHIDFEREDQRGFIGVSEYWYTAHQVLGLGGVWDWGEWEKGMGAFCGRDWKDVEDEVEREKGWKGAQVELSRLQMQCFKGAWISNVLHEGIGIPRLIDQGGAETLTGGEIGDTNAEAERRAREKGLLTEGQSGATRHPSGKPHFQSMDEIGSTAISWTLGKMVIEASKAVPPRSLAQESAWKHKLPIMYLGEGVTVLWAYFAFACLFVLFGWNWIKKRRNGSYSPTMGRRKPSISSGSPLASSPTSWSFWSNGEPSIEDGYTTSNTARTAGRIRLWSLRFANSIRRNLPFAPRSASHDLPLNRTGMSLSRMGRHASMPIHTSSTAYSPSYTSQPPSPRASYFTPAFLANNPTSSTGNGYDTIDSANLSVPFVRPGSTSPEPRRLGTSQSVNDISSLSSSPPRGKNRPSIRARQASFNSASAGGGGWNDPPGSMLGASGDGRESGSGSGVLTPSAGGTSGTDRSLSRQSSRVNLSELGLKERGGSRLGLH